MFIYLQAGIRLALIICCAFLMGCTAKISSMAFVADSVQMNVNFTNISNHDGDYWVFADIDATFPPGRKTLDLRCLHFDIESLRAKAIHFDNAISARQVVVPDLSGKGSRAVYWIFSKKIQLDDLKKSKFVYEKSESCSQL